MPRKSKAKEEAEGIDPEVIQPLAEPEVRVRLADALELGFRRAKEREAAGYWTDINDLTPWKDNPRKNEGRPVEAVMDSIRRFGFATPIIARQEDGQVIAGHTRLKAAKALGLEQVPVRFMDLDPADAKLLALADNKIGELADWDNEVFARIVADVDSAELLLAGFTENDLSGLLDSEPEPDFDAALEADDARDDELPEQVEPITKPGDVVELGPHVLHCGDCIEVMQGMEENSVDAIVTDPPYGLGFMGKAWDALPPGEDWARECLRVLKPGGHLVAFGGQRTIHRLTCSLEDAGFVIRELFGWLNWQGFPKSLDASKALDAHHGAEREVVGTYASHRPNDHADTKYSGSIHTNGQITAPATEDARTWEGYGTALKPCLEPAVIARKPLVGTVAENLLEWATGALNIDGCRYGYGDEAWPGPQEGISVTIHTRSAGGHRDRWAGNVATGEATAHDLGRWPANVYACPKASRGEREEGCEELPGKTGAETVEREEGSAGTQSPRAGAGRTASEVRNHHPTVKPIKLMRWLVRLGGGQQGSVILEPFAGSGTTMLAAEREGFVCIGIEREPAYCDIVRARLGAVLGE